MIRTTSPAEPEHVACEICLKEVPSSEAQVSEAADYVAHFCGLECYEKWQRGATGGPSAAPGFSSPGRPQ
jgi:hypothetical protein